MRKSKGKPKEQQVEKPIEKSEKKFFETLPGIITAIATLITAIVGCVAIFLSPQILDRLFPLTPILITQSVTSTTSLPVVISPTSIPPSSIPQPGITSEPSPIATVAAGANTTSDCQPDLSVDLFNYALSHSKFAALLGREVGHLICVPSSYQPFENGEMIWRSDDPDIYVLFSNHEWKSFKNNYRFGDPLASCNTESPARNRLVPLLGFGKIWCDNQSIKKELGYATVGENAQDRAIQTFENGWLILINYTVHAIFYEKEQWDSVDVFDSTQISLKSRSDLDTKNSNLGLGQGFVVLPQQPQLTILDPLSGKSLSVPFDVGWKVSTQCNYLSTGPVNVQIEANVPHPIRAYLLIQAGWGVKSYEYRTIGKVSLKFDNGKVVETPLILGYNIRDWADRSIAITTLTSPYTQTAWKGFDEDEVPGKIDILIIDIPVDYTSSTLKEIRIDDDSINSTGGMDPCIHLSAVTVSYLP